MVLSGLSLLSPGLCERLRLPEPNVPLGLFVPSQRQNKVLPHGL